MTASQIIELRSSKLDLDAAKKRIVSQLQNNEEMREFVIRHEQMIAQTFDEIYLEIVKD